MGPWSASPSRSAASTSSRGRQGLVRSTAQQWYTMPSNTDRARILTPGACHDEVMTHAADDPLDLERLAAYAEALADAVDDALPRWVERCVGDNLDHLAAGPARDLAEASAREAGRRARAEVG